MTNIPRFLGAKVAHTQPPFRAVVIYGPRRVGKTTLLKELVGTTPNRWYDGELGDDVRALNFQSRGDVENALQQAPVLVIDEAQRVPGIGRIVKQLVDLNEGREHPVKIFVTGSSPIYLAKGVKESALGRVIQRNMWPLSLAEIAAIRKWGEVQTVIDRYLVYGLMPDVYKYPETARDYLMTYCDQLLFKDIFELANISQRQSFLDLVHALAWRIGETVTYEGLGKDVGLSKDTVKKYVELLAQCNIVRVCSSFAKNLDNELKKGKKIYFFDNGIRNAILRNFAPIAERDDVGALWENFFFMERVKLHDTERDFVDMYFWRTSGNRPREVDFIEARDGKMRAFECKFSASAKVDTKLFSATYPQCPVEVVTPADCMRVFGPMANAFAKK